MIQTLADCQVDFLLMRKKNFDKWKKKNMNLKSLKPTTLRNDNFLVVNLEKWDFIALKAGYPQ